MRTKSKSSIKQWYAAAVKHAEAIGVKLPSLVYLAEVGSPQLSNISECYDDGVSPEKYAETQKPLQDTPLTDEEIEKIAKRLHGTTQNVYRLTEMLFHGKSFRDEDWDRLEKISKIFKCDECNEFLLTTHKAKGFDSLCNECLDEIDGVHDDDEE